MEFAMIISGADAPTPAPRVRAVPSETGTGLYEPATRTIWRPEDEAIRAALPPRLRRYVRNREFLRLWYEGDFCRIDEQGRTLPSLPYLEINDARGNRIATAYFAACPDAKDS